MGSEERDMILQMLAEGKVSTAEAADLLDALDTKDAGQSNVETSAEDPYYDTRHWERDARRYERDSRRHERDMRRGHGLADRGLEIHVQDGDETRTHVHIPLGLAAAAGKFLPKKAQEYFEKYGIDLTDLIDSISNDLSRRGEIVNVQDGQTRVHIAVI